MKRVIGQRHIWVFLLILETGCSHSEFVTDTLPPAVVNEAYSYKVDIDRSDADTVYMRKTKGMLPAGIELSGSELSGMPTQPGVYAFTLGLYDGNYYDDYDDYDEDTFWDGFFDAVAGDTNDCRYDEALVEERDFTLFVTEASSNILCPSPARTGLSEVYLCIGTPEVDPNGNGDFVLDLTLYVDPTKGATYGIHAMDIALVYDATQIHVREDLLGSQVMREVLTTAAGSVAYDTSTPGLLQMTLTAGEAAPFEQSGRLLDIPFQVVDGADLTAASDISFGDTTTLSGATAFDTLLIDGAVSQE